MATIIYLVQNPFVDHHHSPDSGPLGQDPFGNQTPPSKHNQYITDLDGLLQGLDQIVVHDMTLSHVDFSPKYPN